MPETNDRFDRTERDETGDAEARQWARKTRDALESGTTVDDSDALAARLDDLRTTKRAEQ